MVYGDMRKDRYIYIHIYIYIRIYVHVHISTCRFYKGIKGLCRVVWGCLCDVVGV